MSVTFTFAEFKEITFDGETTVGLVHGTSCRHTCPLPAGECEDATIYFGFCEHADAAQAACGCKDFDVNVSNANATAILERLGFEVDGDSLYGEATPDDFLGRALVANIGRDDSGYAATVDRGEGGATFIDCGVPAGYYDTRLASLVALATEAKRREVMVAWA